MTTLTGRSRDAAEVDALRALYRQTVEGWNRGSGDAFAAPFSDDCDFVAFDGQRFRGRVALVAFHGPLFGTHLKGTRLVGDVTDVKFLGDDVAVLHAYGGTIPAGRREAVPERDSIQTLVAAKREGRWQLVAFQNTRVRPIGRNALGTLLWLVTDRLWRWCLPGDHQRPLSRAE